MKGIITAVNNNGICINQQWYNATDKCANMIESSLKGKEVEIMLLPNSNLFNNIIVQTSPNKGFLGVTGCLDKDRLIVRQNSLSQASSFLNLCLIHGFLENKEDICAKDFEAIYFEFAKRCEEWVFNNGK